VVIPHPHATSPTGQRLWLDIERCRAESPIAGAVTAGTRTRQKKNRCLAAAWMSPSPACSPLIHPLLARCPALGPTSYSPWPPPAPAAALGLGILVQRLQLVLKPRPLLHEPLQLAMQLSRLVGKCLEDESRPYKAWLGPGSGWSLQQRDIPCPQKSPTQSPPILAICRGLGPCGSGKRLAIGRPCLSVMPHEGGPICLPIIGIWIGYTGLAKARRPVEGQILTFPPCSPSPAGFRLRAKPGRRHPIKESHSCLLQGQWSRPEGLISERQRLSGSTEPANDLRALAGRAPWARQGRLPASA
jgi:hypothetical protein